MNKNFLIRTAAFRLLEELYLSSDHNLKSNIHPSDITDDKINLVILQKAAIYLKEKSFITYNNAPCDYDWSATITANGIDWLEDFYQINPLKYPKD